MSSMNFQLQCPFVQDVLLQLLCSWVVLTWATMPLCMGGAGIRGSLNLREKVFFLMQCPGAVLPPAGWAFLRLCCGCGSCCTSLNAEPMNNKSYPEPTLINSIKYDNTFTQRKLQHANSETKREWPWFSQDKTSLLLSCSNYSIQRTAT